MAVPFKGFKGCPTFYTFPQKSNHQFHRIWHLQKGTSSTAANSCFQLTGDSRQRSPRIWCGEWVGKMFWETNIQIFCLANRLFVGFTEFFGWLHGWQRSFVMNVFLLRKDCFRHDLGKGGLRWWNFFLQPFVWNSVCDTVDGWNPAPPGMRNPIYSINNRINYLSTGARFQPST